MPHVAAPKRLLAKDLGLETAVVRVGGVEAQQRTVARDVRRRLELALNQRKVEKERRERYPGVLIDGPRARPSTRCVSYPSL